MEHVVRSDIALAGLADENVFGCHGMADPVNGLAMIVVDLDGDVDRVFGEWDKEHVLK